jgi:hypothetical protein
MGLCWLLGFRLIEHLHASRRLVLTLGITSQERNWTHLTTTRLPLICSTLLCLIDASANKSDEVVGRGFCELTIPSIVLVNHLESSDISAACHVLYISWYSLTPEGLVLYSARRPSSDSHRHRASDSFLFWTSPHRKQLTLWSWWGLAPTC